MPRPWAPLLGLIAAAFPALAGAEVVVTGSSSLVDLERSSISTAITREIVMQVPAARNAQEILTMSVVSGPVRDPVAGVNGYSFKVEPSKSLEGRPTFPTGTTIDFGGGQTFALGDRYALRPGADPQLTFKIRRPGEKTPAVEGRIALDPGGTPSAAPATGPTTYAMPPIAVAGRVSVIRGTLSGDGTRTTVRIGERALPIVAENPRSVFFKIPDDFAAGSYRVLLEDGGLRVELPIAVLRMTMSADQLKLHKGQSTRLHVAISGPESWDPGVWRAGVPSDLCDVAAMTKKFPGFHAPDPEAEGFLLFSITNLSPSVIAIDEFARPLSKKDFSAGSYKYDAGIGAVSDGGFGIHGEVQAFLAPNTAESRPIAGEAPPKK